MSTQQAGTPGGDGEAARHDAEGGEARGRRAVLRCTLGELNCHPYLGGERRGAHLCLGLIFLDFEALVGRQQEGVGENRKYCRGPRLTKAYKEMFYKERRGERGVLLPSSWWWIMDVSSGRNFVFAHRTANIMMPPPPESYASHLPALTITAEQRRRYHHHHPPI